jgi:hypothetical protein
LVDVSVDVTSMTVNPKQQTSMTVNPKQQTSMTVNAKLQSDTEGEEKDAYYGKFGLYMNIIMLTCVLNFMFLLLFNVKKMRKICPRCKMISNNKQTSVLGKHLFRKNQIVKKKSSLPSKYELTHVGHYSESDDDYDDIEFDIHYVSDN